MCSGRGVEACLVRVRVRVRVGVGVGVRARVRVRVGVRVGVRARVRVRVRVRHQQPALRTALLLEHCARWVGTSASKKVSD